MKFLKLRMIWNIIRNRPVIANNIFKGGFAVLNEEGIISNNKIYESENTYTYQSNEGIITVHGD